jgi:hypothetical protein
MAFYPIETASKNEGFIIQQDESADGYEVARWSAEKPTEALMNRCHYCAGRFGLISHRHLWKRFCRKHCKENYLTAQARKIEATRRQWFTFIAKPF